MKDPKMNTSFLATAARRARSEVRYATLNASEKDLFDKAKTKELNCWLETSAVRKIMRSKISPNRIMTSRWILTWKPDPSMPKGQKAKARLVVRGYQDPELDQVSTESPTLSRDARMLVFADDFIDGLGSSELRHHHGLSPWEIRRKAISHGTRSGTPETFENDK